MAKPKELPGAVVGDAKPRHRMPRPVRRFFASVKQLFADLTHHSLIVLVIILALVVSGTVAAIYVNNKRGTSVACTDEIIKNASQFLAMSKTNDLKPIVMSIQKEKNYEKDVNCLYITTVYYMNVGDISRAKQELDSFNKVYNSKNVVSTSFGQLPIPVTGLKQRIAFMEKLQQETAANSDAITKGGTKRK